ncbi:MAG TPA: sugar transferase [Bryobacteraceae bacterium]|nr:sugar transferase [Bryobacteraceae bacterium]
MSSTPLIQTARESAQLPALELTERAFGLLLLAIASPVLVASGFAVAIFSRRSPLVAHLRVTRNGEPFWMLKLRTMWGSDEPAAASGLVEHIVAEPDTDAKDPSDARVTSRLAAFCRRHSIDELPQLWHVVRGEMSLVGPRPLTRAEIHRHYGERAAELLSVKPGLTGLWQVAGRSAIRFPQRSALDLELVRSLKPGVYLTILLRTLPALITGKGAW